MVRQLRQGEPMVVRSSGVGVVLTLVLAACGTSQAQRTLSGPSLTTARATASPSASGTAAGPTTTASSGATVAPSALVLVSRASPTPSSRSAATHNLPPTPNPGFWSQIATTSLPL